MQHETLGWWDALVWAIVLCIVLVSMPLIGCLLGVVPGWLVVELVLPSADVSTDIFVLFTSLFYSQVLFAFMVIFLLAPTLGFVNVLWVHENLAPGTKSTEFVMNRFVEVFCFIPCLFGNSAFKFADKFPLAAKFAEPESQEHWWSVSVTFTLRTFAGTERPLKIPLGHDSRKLERAVMILVTRAVALVVYGVLLLAVVFVYAAYYSWCALIFVSSIPLGLSFFVIKTTLTLILGLLLFQTKIFAVPKLQRQWNRAWTEREQPPLAAATVDVADFQRSMLTEIICESVPMLVIQSINLRLTSGSDVGEPTDIISICFSSVLAFRALWNIAVPYLFHGKELEDIEIGGMFSFLGGEFAKTHVGKDCEGRAQSSRDLLGNSKVAPGATAATPPFSRQQSEVVCSICLESYRDRVWTNCDHSFCKACITQVCRTNPPENRAPCPFCREPVLLSDLRARPPGGGDSPGILRVQVYHGGDGADIQGPVIQGTVR